MTKDTEKVYNIYQETRVLRLTQWLFRRSNFMNIFVLDYDPFVAAQYHADIHINKMVLESAQMLCSVMSKWGHETPYKPTHANHPCTRWVGMSRSNAAWVCMLAEGLNREAQQRYKKHTDHKSWGVIRDMLPLLDTLPDYGLTPFALAMPEEYKSDDAVQAYRNYYHSKPKMQWRHGFTPHWWEGE